jgi:hypothetical protein
MLCNRRITMLPQLECASASSSSAARYTKQMIADFLEHNAPKMQRLFDRVAGHVKASMKLYMEMTELCIPKLTRPTVVGAPDEPLRKPIISITFPNGGSGEPVPEQQPRPAVWNKPKRRKLLSSESTAARRLIGYGWCGRCREVGSNVCAGLAEVLCAGDGEARDWWNILKRPVVSQSTPPRTPSRERMTIAFQNGCI